MPLVHGIQALQRLVKKALTALLLITLLAACGSNAAATPSTQTKPASPAHAPAGAALSLNLNPTKISAQAGDLLVQSNWGFQCPYGSLTTRDQDLELGHLVLASDRTSYSQAEIAQMRSYLTSYFQGIAEAKSQVEGIQPPPTLHWVLGAETTAVPGASQGRPGQPGPGCQAVLTLTNTGTTPIQIPKVGVQLKAQPQPNTYRYHLIDICNVSGLKWPYCPINGNAGCGSNCCFYAATIQLGAGKLNDGFSAPLTGDSSCSMTILPATQITLQITFSPPANGPQNLIYSIEPTFTIETTQGEQTVALPQLASIIAFASASQFSCYGLQGTTFVLLKSPTLTPNWCL